jgi:hypothetical protein
MFFPARAGPFRTTARARPLRAVTLTDVDESAVTKMPHSGELGSQRAVSRKAVEAAAAVGGQQESESGCISKRDRRMRRILWGVGGQEHAKGHRDVTRSTAATAPWGGGGDSSKARTRGRRVAALWHTL